MVVHQTILRNSSKIRRNYNEGGRQMKRTQVAIVGAGPAGLAAAIEVARAGGKVTLLDENSRPGGQLFKQIHKFFGSREHKAGVRGFRIGEQLLEDTKRLGVEVLLDSPVYGIFRDFTIGYINANKEYSIKAERIILATGASENALAFPGATLPGVMGAGAAQTLINVHRVLPGKKVIMVGSGNVGLIVSYQLMQAGADVVALIEAAPEIGGYGVHASKIRRAGVPIYTSHTIKEVFGKDCVEGAVIVQLGGDWQPIEGTERILKADTVCIAVGLNPLSELAWLAGCEFAFIPELGGHVPKHDLNMETTLKGLYVAGDITGVEEASSAMEEGRLAGIACAESLGLYPHDAAERLKQEVRERLNALRTGPFGQKRRDAKDRLVKLFRGSEQVE
jgi:thioredoxin reductase